MPAEYSVSGKVALITGALGAIGTAIAQKLLTNGAKVVFADIRDVNEGTELVAKYNNNACYVHCDVRSSEDIANALRHAVATFGRLDILVNNAAVFTVESLYRTETFAAIQMGIDVNLRGPIEFSRQFVQYIWEDKANRSGVIINMASMSGCMPTRGIEVYAATKSALLNFTHASKSLAPAVRVSALAPYYVDTPAVNQSKGLAKSGIIKHQLVVSTEQVAEATVRTIQDKKSAGKAYVLIGNWAVRANLFIYEFSFIAIMVVAFFSLFVAKVKGIGPPPEFVQSQDALTRDEKKTK
ncbi:NAD(P)-binding protein [Linderina pennispora]|uniref:NAD(P)-binding protein n=1 Tax=Linderina pennispora TaxID=61395 RepID=A0A1Y1VXP9_9FUNG|nr:NAD(P)-binding protein [Linderina pennispora]ORX65805.1 NAD(P)-binding protein [Linderina pennispora]